MALRDSKRKLDYGGLLILKMSHLALCPRLRSLNVSYTFIAITNSGSETHLQFHSVRTTFDLHSLKNLVYRGIDHSDNLFYLFQI